MASVLKNIALALFDMGALNNGDDYVLSKMNGIALEKVKYLDMKGNYRRRCYAGYVKKY